MQLTNIPLDKIRPNSYNPNVVDEKTMGVLKRSIERDGFLQPIILRKLEKADKDGFEYEVIDGEHRFKVLSSLDKYTEAPSVVLESDDNLSKVQTINMNKLRGTFDTIKLAELLVDLQNHYTTEELEEMLGYTSEELQSYEELAGLNFEEIQKIQEEHDAETADALNSQPEEEDVHLENKFEVVVNFHQLDMIEAFFRQETGEKESTGEALYRVIAQLMKADYTEAYDEVMDRKHALDSAEFGLDADATLDEAPSQEVPE